MTTVQTYGAKALRQILLGKEVTRGTAVLPTTIWRGEGTLADDSTFTTPVEDIGTLMPPIRNYVSFRGGTLNLSATPATFEQFPHILEMAIQKQATGVQDGSGSDYVYTYPFPTTAALTAGTYSIEAGDNALAEQTTYAYCENFKLSGKSGQAIMVSATLKTRRVNYNNLSAPSISFDGSNHLLDANNGLAIFSAGMRVKVNGTSSNNGIKIISAASSGQLTLSETTYAEASGSTMAVEQYFTAVSVPAVKEMIFNASKLYIDDVTGSFGGTQLSGTFMGFDMDYNSGMRGVSPGDGRSDMDLGFLKGLRPSGTLKLTFEMENGAKAEKAKWRSNTPRLFRILCEGPALGTAGTTYAKKTMILDFAGIYTKFNALSEDNGNDQVVAEVMMGYDPTNSSAGEIKVVNELASLP